MPAKFPTLALSDRSGLSVLCLLLAASVFVRIHTYRDQPEGGGVATWEAPGSPVDLGRGVLLSRAVVRDLTVSVETCSSPVSIKFIRVSPYEPDPSLIGQPQPEDRVFYVYRGWNLGSHLIAIGINFIYFTRRAYARVMMQGIPATDDLALKIIVPPRCDASPDEVMSALRLNLRPPEPSSALGSARHS